MPSLMLERLVALEELRQTHRQNCALNIRLKTVEIINLYMMVDPNKTPANPFPHDNTGHKFWRQT